MANTSQNCIVLSFWAEKEKKKKETHTFVNNHEKGTSSFTEELSLFHSYSSISSVVFNISSFKLTEIGIFHGYLP